MPAIELIRSRIQSGTEPWKSAFAKLQGSGTSIKTASRPVSYRFSSLSYEPSPVPVVQSADSGGLAYIAAHPELGLADIGSVEHLDDAIAAYTQALMWVFTGNEAHAEKAVEIMDAWSSTLREIKFDQPRRTDNNAQVYANGKLQAAWGAQLNTRAAELIRYTYNGWSAAGIARYEKMLNDVYLPLTITGWTGGANWLMSFAEATIGIGVFNDDRAAFEAGVQYWRSKVPSTIYLASDGPTPISPSSVYNTPSKLLSYWHNPSQYISGLQGETLRDISHMAMGMGAMTGAAETARIQGVDLYGEEQERLVKGFELNAGFVNQYLDETERLGQTPPSTWKPSGWPGSTFKVGGTGYRNGWEMAYAHYARRLGVPMPNTKRLIERLRPTGTALHMSWDTLTSAR